MRVTKKCAAVVADTRRLYNGNRADDDELEALKAVREVLCRHRVKLNDRRTPLRLAVSRLSADLSGMQYAYAAFSRLVGNVGSRTGLKLALTSAIANLNYMLDELSGKGANNE